MTVDVNNAVLPYSGDVSIKIDADFPIMAERAMYWGQYFSEPWFRDILGDLQYHSVWESRVGGHASIGYSK